MIDGIRTRRQYDNLHPEDREHMSKHMVAGDHSKDRFKTPNEVAAAEEEAGSSGTASNLLPKEPPKKKRSFKAWWAGLNQKQRILVTAGAVVAASGLILGAYFLFFSQSAPIDVPIIQKQEPKEEPKPTTVPSNLTGMPVDPGVNDRPVTAIMIENSLDARPQSGLHQAGVVFEAIAEGGITRFVALFQDTEPDYVGPVRSVRPYYLQWLRGFDAAVAHAGGSAEALLNINQWGIKDLNHNGAYFWRVNNRAAPHNLYTSIPKLWEYEATKGFGKANFTPLPRKAKEQPAATPNARSINLNVSSANFAVHYDYDTTTNSYRRSVGGAAHTDERSGVQLSPKVVVVLVLPQGKSGIYTTYQTIGTGQVFVFQDGVVNVGTWKKDSREANFTFTHNNGVPLELNPGQTWFTALGSASLLSYSP
jgi:hypothetical protein